MNQNKQLTCESRLSHKKKYLNLVNILRYDIRIYNLWALSYIYVTAILNVYDKFIITYILYWNPKMDSVSVVQEGERGLTWANCTQDQLCCVSQRGINIVEYYEYDSTSGVSRNI